MSGNKANSRPTTARDMTKDQIKAFQETFKLFDKNGDGKISYKDLGEMLRTMGYDPSNQELKDLIANADSNSNGYLEFEEFLNFTIKPTPGDDEGRAEELMAAFRFFDNNGDGFIVRSELKTAMRKIGETTRDSDIDAIIKEADLDKDGRINYVEFVEVLIKKF